MTLLNFTFQESSPLITYTGGWTEGSSSNDTLSASYNGSFRVTQQAGAAASLTFIGTAVSLFGATRPNHGNYTVVIDQQPPFAAVGSTLNNEFNKSLWHADNLGFTQHTVTLTNVPSSTGIFLDLDFVSIERQIGQPTDNIFQITLDDTSSSVEFAGSWESTTGSTTAYQGTLHNTVANGSNVSVSFQGCCIELYGQYANALYTVVLDNQPPLEMQGLDVDLAPNFQHPQTLLYLVDGLSEEFNHTVTLTNSQSNENRPFFFDYAVVSSTHQLISNSTSSPSSISPGSNSSSDVGRKSGSPAGEIAGGVVGGLAVILLIGLGTLLLARWRRRRRNKRSFPLDLVEEDPGPLAEPYILPGNPSLTHEYYGLQISQGLTLHSPPLHVEPLVHPSNSGPQTPHASSYDAGEYCSATSLLSSQERSSSSSSSGQPSLTMTTTNAPAVISPQPSRSTFPSQRDAKRHVSHSQPAVTGNSQEPVVQEEDGGVVLDPEDATMSRSLPPAYKPEWHQNLS